VKPATWFDERDKLKELCASLQDDDEEMLEFFLGGEDEYKCMRVCIKFLFIPCCFSFLFAPQKQIADQARSCGVTAVKPPDFRFLKHGEVGASLLI